VPSSGVHQAFVQIFDLRHGIGVFAASGPNGLHVVKGMMSATE